MGLDWSSAQYNEPALFRNHSFDGIHSLPRQKMITLLRQTPQSRIKLSPFQLHMGKRVQTEIIITLGQEDCLLANWKRPIRNDVSAHLEKIQVFITRGVVESERADYKVINDGRKRYELFR